VGASHLVSATVTSVDLERAMQQSAMFARRVFTVAGIWGVAVLMPLYFSFDAIGRLYPPTITHPDFFYGFVGVALVWQLVFLLIARDPVGLRLMMIPAMLEKFVYVSTLSVLYARGDVSGGQFTVAAPDCVLGVLFAIALAKIAAARRPPVSSLDYSGVFGD
jgi:uncharacterized membrane protein YuzA (DUF378 family)